MFTSNNEKETNNTSKFYQSEAKEFPGIKTNSKKSVMLNISQNYNKMVTTNEALKNKLGKMDKTSSELMKNAKFRIKKINNDLLINRDYLDDEEGTVPDVAHLDQKYQIDNIKNNDNKHKSAFHNAEASSRNTTGRLRSMTSAMNFLDKYKNIIDTHTGNTGNNKFNHSLSFDLKSIKHKFNKEAKFSNTCKAKKEIFAPTFPTLSTFDKKTYLKKLEMNEKLFDFINNRNLTSDNDNDKKLNINKIHFRNMSMKYEHQMMPYLKHVTSENMDKYDYIHKIENGDIIKDELGLNAMNSFIPGNILTGVTKKLEVVHPRYIKSKFKKKFEIFEYLKPKEYKPKKN